MKILILNCGSSSLKYQLIDMDDQNVMAVGLCERIGIDGRLKHTPSGKEKFVSEKPLPDHTVAVQSVIDALLDKEHGVISSVDEINAVGHRVVHGGEFFSKSVVIDDEVIKAIEACVDLAPLHNPANLIGIRACAKLMPNVAQVAVFDTAFHQTMPKKAFLYALPYEMYEDYKIRKYGFHGTSHKYVSEKCIELLNKPAEETKIITCHLGNGGSICAVLGGKSIDTSMGFTPLEGLVMGTRCGDIDPAVVTYLIEKKGMTAKEVDELMNKKSGVLGVSGVSSDFRDLWEAKENNNERAEAALDSFHYKVSKYIGEYFVALGGADAVVFTAGLGENSPESRSEICNYLKPFGVEIDEEKNKTRGKVINIAAPSSKIAVYVIPTNEELMIAKDTKELLDK